MAEIRVISTSGSIPAVSQLALGDLALNTFDGKVYLKKFADNTQTIIEIGGGNTDLFINNVSFSNPNLTFTRGNETTFDVNLSSLVPATASFAISASYAPIFPYTGSALITGSLGVTGSFSTTDTVFLKGIINQTTPVSHVVTFDNTTGRLYITASSAFGGGGGGGSTPGGNPDTIQFNNAGVLDGSDNFKLVGGNSVYLTGSLLVTGSALFIGGVTGSSFTGSFTGSLFGTSSWAISASQAVSSSYATSASFVDYNNIVEYSDLSRNTIASVKNVSGGTIPKGTPCYVTASGTSGNLIGIIPADAGNPNLMPAGVINAQDLADGAEGLGYLDGFINGVDTSTFTSGDEVFVAVGGGYTNIKPTGSALIQPLGYVEKVDSSNGSGLINGPGHFFEVPNITSGYTWVGNSDQVATPVPTASLFVASASFASTASYVNPLTQSVFITGSTFISSSNATQLQIGSNLLFVSGSGNVGIGTTSPSASLDVSGSGRFSGNLTITGSATNSLLVRGSGTTNSTFSANFVNSSAQETFQVRDDGAVKIGGGTFFHPTQTLFQVNTLAGTELIRMSSTQMLVPSTFGNIGGTGLTINGNAGLTLSAVNGNIGTINIGNAIVNSVAYTNTTRNFLTLNQGWNAVAGSSNLTINALVLSNAINFTNSTGTNIARGLYVNPTLTSVADYRAIETTTGSVIFNNGNVGIRTTTPSASLDVSGSARITNGLTVTGSLIAPSITGSLLGTASFATNSLLLNGTGSSIFATTGSNVFKGDQVITGSFKSTGSFEVKSDSVDLYGSTNIILNSTNIVAPVLPFSVIPGGAILNTVLIDTNNGTLYVTSSLPGGGSSLTSGSFTGSFSGSFTGSLLGTASFSISASQAISSSYSFISTSSSFATSASFAISSSRAVSSSYALSASYAPGGAAFPYTGSAEITGSLTVRGASLVQDGSLGVVSTGTTNATEAFKVQNATPSDLLVVRDDGEIVVNTTKYSLNGILTNNGGIITEVNGYNGMVVIQQPTPDPPITLDIQNGLIINVM